MFQIIVSVLIVAVAVQTPLFSTLGIVLWGGIIGGVVFFVVVDP